MAMFLIMLVIQIAVYCVFAHDIKTRVRRVSFGMVNLRTIFGDFINISLLFGHISFGKKLYTFSEFLTVVSTRSHLFAL